MDTRLVVYALVVFLTAIFQQTALFAWGGVKANMLLLIVLVYAFFVRNVWEYGLILIAAALGLLIEFNFDWPIAAFLLVGVGVYVVRRALPWQSWLSYGALLILGTLALYALIDWRFIVEMPTLVAQELVYNCLIGIIVYWLAARFYEKKSGRKF